MQTLQQQKQSEWTEYSPIPEKRFFTIGEVSKLCEVKPHVLRYWEQEFKQINPAKRKGNRRYYSQKDIHTIREIKTLLYAKGFTILGAKQQLQHSAIIASSIQREEIIEAKESLTDSIEGESLIKNTVKQLEDLLAILDNGASRFQA